jgi:DNA polymerase-1
LFLWQRRKYNLTIIEKVEQLDEIADKLDKLKPSLVAWDTETTGLDFIKDKPFLFGFGFDKDIYIMKPKKDLIIAFYKLLKVDYIKYFMAHNAKYDYHMMKNINLDIPEYVPISDSLALARITDYADSLESISLEALGIKIVHDDAKFAGNVIKEHIKKITAERRNMAKKLLKQKLGTYKIGAVWESYMNRIQYIESENEELFNWIDSIYAPANYLDSYIENPNLMINYLADDILLVLEVSKKLLGVLPHVDPTNTLFNRECELVRAVGDFEREGLPVDINYILESKIKVENYQKELYDKLHKLSTFQFTVGQEQVIKRIFATKYKIGLVKTDAKALKEVISKYSGEPAEVADLILELRTVDKWLSTYIIGILNKLKNGKLYTEINNSGALTGRVSSDLQQMPKESITTREGVELFHPRGLVVPSGEQNLYFIDYSNMEMRVQANYTLKVASGDYNMCSAFTPYKHKSKLTGLEYDIVKDYTKWNSGEWINESGNPWIPTDLHTLTTKKAFPSIDESHPNWSHYRSIGKAANFLKIYGGGKNALMEQLKLTEEQAQTVDNAYYEAYPAVKDYQKWVENNLRMYGNVKSLMDRKYFIENMSFSYRFYNYLIQGDCAYLLKQKEIEIMRFLKDYKSKLLLVIHDEVVLSIEKGEEHIVEKIKEILEDTSAYLEYIPMVCEISTTYSNWAAKEKIK